MSDHSQSLERPNILLIVVDDLGFSDLGFNGSEIRTPNLDRLANQGVQLTNFHVSPACSPTRAMLLTGVDSHIVGLGTMAGDQSPNQLGKPGYEGYLNFEAVTLPELLRDGGYNTYMTGKWHLGGSSDTNAQARGFDRSFALIPGGAGHFANRLPLVGPELAGYTNDGNLVEELPEDFYSTEYYTDKMIEYIQSGKESAKPFFGYLAFTAPHWPLQAPAESIAKYEGVYDEGYDVLHANRLNAMIEIGLIAENVEPFPKLNGEKDWENLTIEEKKYQARLMEVYAAMVDDIDQNIGRLLAYLSRIGELDNTMIFFMSDNGPEGHHLEIGWESLANWAKECCDNSYNNLGRPDSYVWYGPNWGRAGNPPYRMFKAYTGQGGVRAPAFAYFPKEFPGGRKSEAFITVKDLLPTFLEVAQLESPGSLYNGREIAEVEGRSALDLFSGNTDTVREVGDYMAWELFGKCALQQGDWKIIKVPTREVVKDMLPTMELDKWQLYNLADDPAEMHDLSDSNPEKLAQLLKLWEEYVHKSNVIVADDGSGY